MKPKKTTRQTLRKLMSAAPSIGSKIDLAENGLPKNGWHLDSDEKLLAWTWDQVRSMLGTGCSIDDVQYVREELSEICTRAMLKDDDAFFDRLSKAMKWHRKRQTQRHPADQYRLTLLLALCRFRLDSTTSRTHCQIAKDMVSSGLLRRLFGSEANEESQRRRILKDLALLDPPGPVSK